MDLIFSDYMYDNEKLGKKEVMWSELKIEIDCEEKYIMFHSLENEMWCVT